jgi:hypothetical protein
MAYTCHDAITPPDGDPTKLCNGVHGTTYDLLESCSCGGAGACKTDCGDNACMGTSASGACTSCLQTAAPAGCKAEYDACVDDK